MKYYLCQTAEGPTLAPTQAEAKKIDPRFKEWRIPDAKDEQMAFLTGLLREIETLKAAPTVAAPSAPAPVVQAPPPPRVRERPPVMNLDDDRIEEIIYEASNGRLSRFFLAAVTRVGELGRPAWQSIQARRDQFADSEATVGSHKRDRKLRIPGSEERGFRYIALALVANLDGAAPPVSADQFVG